MKRHNLIFKRFLSCAMAFAMLLPFCAMLIPVVALAVETVSEDSTPRVSLTWDSAVAVTDGVATPYKNAASGATSYTMKYTVKASGTIAAPITVRVQSFDLSAKAGQEYATVDTAFTLTAQAPTATGTVTVYTHSGYATKVTDTGRVYTNEFGLRITEITNAKKQSGSDTLRSQVLAKNGYTLSVSKNSEGGNYGGGTGDFGNGYVYSAMTQDYVKQFISSVTVKPDNDQADVTFNPYTYLNSQTNDMPRLLAAYPDTKVYYNGTGKITEKDANKTRYGFFIRITDGGTNVFDQHQHAKKKWDGWSFNWLTYGYANDHPGDHPNANGDFNVINTSVSAYHKTASYGDKYLVQSSTGNLHMILNTCNSDLNNQGKEYHSFYFAAMAANNTAVTAKEYSIENRVYGAGDTVYLTVRFNKPVQFENNAANPLQIQADVGGSTANYFTYCGGNMTDTLIFCMTLPTDREINGNSIALKGFVNEDYNKKLGDLLWNTSNKNNMWTVSDAQVAGKTFACSVDTRTPDISIQNIVGNAGTVKSASFGVTVLDITNQGSLEIAWTKEATPPTAEDAWSPVTFLADGNDTTTVNIERKGLTGTYYAHLRATSISSNQTVHTVGPFTFDNQSPTISSLRLADGDSAQKYLKEHTLLFNVSDVSIGVDKVYMKARHTDGSLGLKDDAEQLLVYDSTKASNENLLSITENAAQITVKWEWLDLASNSYGAYIFGFYAVDELGNQSDLCELSDGIMFDNRNTFEATLQTGADFSVKGKQLYYNGRTLTFAHTQEGSSHTWEICSLTYNGINVTGALSQNGFGGTANDTQKSYQLTLDTEVQGYIEIVFKLNGERESNVINFYVTGRDVQTPNYKNLYAESRLLINEAWQLSTDTFYAGSNRNGSYYTGISGLKPIFSSRGKALDYAKFFEKQDIVIEYIDDEVEKNNLEGGWRSDYRKAEADKNRVVAVGQTWLRYKSNAWTLNSNNEEHWVYYFYSEERVGKIDPMLTPALNAAIDRNAKLICNYDGDNRIYLTANNTSKGYTNTNGEPYYDARGILTEALSHGGIYSYEISLSADTDIYDSFIAYGEYEVPLVANYSFTVDGAHHGFVYYRQQGTEAWFPLANGESLKDKLSASGLYEVCEFSNGYRSYLVYVDLDAPVISYQITVDGESKSGYITADTSGGTLRASRFRVGSLVNGVVDGGLSIERDEWAYFYVLYNSLGGGEHTFMTMSDLNRNGYELSTGIYKIYACDRLGNTVVQIIKINTEDIKVEGEVGTAGLTVTSNRAPSDIMAGTFKVYRDNALLSDVTYAQSMTFAQSGEYLITFEDVYGNVVSKSFLFRRDLPAVSFYREKAPGTGRYEAITVNSEDTNNLSQVITEDHQLFTVSTSASIRISYAVSSGYGYEFIGGAPEYKPTTLSATNIDIDSDSKNWMLKIFHEKDPDVYILITCIVDKSPPLIEGSVFAKEYAYNDQKANADNVLFAPTGNTSGSTFYSGDRAVGNSAVVSWSDETRVASVTYTPDGGEAVAVNPSAGSVTLTDVGSYAFEAVDVFGNVSEFTFDLTNHIDFEFMMGGEVQTPEYDPEHYISGNKYTQTLYTGKEMQLVLKENALLAFYFTNGDQSLLYNLTYEVKDGRASLMIAAFDAEEGAFSAIENGEIALAASGKVFRGDIVMNYTYQNGVLTLQIPQCERAYELWQLRVSDFTGHNPVVIQAERSGKTSSFDFVREDGEKPNLSYNGFVGSNQKLTLDNASISEDTVSIVAYYSVVYTETFEKTEQTVLYGADAVPTLEREGYYKIVATNKYGNERTVYIAVSFTLSINAHIEYDQTNGRVQTLNVPDAYSLFSNKSVRLTVWDARATVACQKNGAAMALDVTRENGYLEFALSAVGEYTVTVSDESGNAYALTVSIKAPVVLGYDQFLTGFNENALKKDQNYTNGALSLDKERLEASGIRYVAFRRVGESDLNVLFDTVDVVSPLEYLEENFKESIGLSDGEYEVLFCDVYGNLHTETVRISQKPMLSILRQTQDTAEPAECDFAFALQNGAWSNYKLTFVNTSEHYLLKINGEAASFVDGTYTLTLPTSLGAGEETYELSYVDDYGNSYEIKLHLYRHVPEFDVAKDADTVVLGGLLYAKSDFSMVWGDKIQATYSFNGGATLPFEKSMRFTEDGKYTLVFTDYAGNVSTQMIVKDSTVLYDMASDGFVLFNGASVSEKVTLSLGEELTFKVMRNGEEYAIESRSFTEDGHYVVTLTDRIGNVSRFEFTIYKKARQSFTFAVPAGYSFSQIWYVGDGQRMSMVGDVVLNEDGAQCYLFAIDGAYEIELRHTKSDQIFYFKLQIDNLPPEAVLVGAENGGVTRNNVSIEDLKSGDVIYVYKNGELFKTYIVEGSSETTLNLLGNGDFGSYSVVIRDEAGNSSSFEFVKEFATNTYSNIFICLLLISLGALGITYIRFNGKVRTK